jgi:hypothetical protein
MFVSHPSVVTFPLQLARPALHVNPHDEKLAQAVVPFGPEGQLELKSHEPSELHL